MGAPQVEDTVEYPRPKKWLGVRHAQCIMLFFALVLAFGMRVNLSLAIVAMTDSSNDNTFDWSMQTQSVILSSFFWGYVCLQVPGGELAARIGGKMLVLTCIAVNSTVTLLIPLAANYGGWKAVCACRIVQGLAQGPIYPSLHTLISKWAPLEEKARLTTLIYAGGQLGTAFQLIISGFIADSLGWPAIFYVHGCLGAIWTVIYAFLGSDRPASSSIISQEEKMYIQSSLGHVGQQKKFKTPWSSIVTSLPFFALLVTHCGSNWGFWTLMTEMPSYMSSILGVNIKSNGVISALPYLAMYCLSFPFGIISDYALKKDWVSITAARKISNTISQVGPAIALLGLTYAPAGNVAAAVGCLIFVVGLNAGHYTGFMLVHIDMAPNFAGTLLGITNGIAGCISIIAPLVAGVLLKDETNAADWQKVFYLSSAIYIVCNTFYLIFGTSKLQKWNEPNDDTQADSEVGGYKNSEKKEEKAV